MSIIAYRRRMSATKHVAADRLPSIIINRSIEIRQVVLRRCRYPNYANRCQRARKRERARARTRGGWQRARCPAPRAASRVPLAPRTGPARGQRSPQPDARCTRCPNAGKTRAVFRRAPNFRTYIRARLIRTFKFRNAITFDSNFEINFKYNFLIRYLCKVSEYFLKHLWDVNVNYFLLNVFVKVLSQCPI